MQACQTNTVHVNKNEDQGHAEKELDLGPDYRVV